MMKDKPLIFSLRRGGELAVSLAKKMGVGLSQCRTVKFSDGNIFVELLTKVQNQEVILVQSLAGEQVDSDFLELVFYADAAKRAGARRVTVIIPYFSYAKADKHDRPGTSLRARVCADCLESAGVERVMMMDLHSPSIPGFFRISVTHVSAQEKLCQRIKKYGLSELVVVSPDAGFVKNAYGYADRLERGCVVCNKNRLDDSEKPNVLAVVGEVKNKNLVIVDDFTTSGGTLIEVAKQLLGAGAKSVMAAVSHAPVDEKAAQKIMDSPLKSLLTTNSVAGIGRLSAKYSKLEILDVADLFSEAY